MREARSGAGTLIDAIGKRDAPLAVDRKPVQNFLNHLAGKRKAIVDAESSLAMTEVCLRARESAEANALPQAR